MIDDDQLRLDLARLGLGLDQGHEGIGGQDEAGNATLLQFDAVMETPRRTRPSIRYGEQGRPVFRGQLVDHRRRCRLGRAVLLRVVDIVGGAKGGHAVA